MKPAIVTITAYKRPYYLKQCLEAIKAADLTHIERIVVSCDAHSKDMHDRMFSVVEDAGLKNATINLMLRRFGVANHPRVLINEIIERYPGGHPIIALEEDTVVSPDAFNLAWWGVQQRDYKFVNLGAGVKTEKYWGCDDFIVYDDWELRSPYAWAFHPIFWQLLEPYWNGKIRAPYGWDWQVSHLCYREGWFCLTPALSRCRNIGRDEGTYDTPENWDRDRKDELICRESTDIISNSNYYIVNRNRPSKEDWPEWVKKEMAP